MLELLRKKNKQAATVGLEISDTGVAMVVRTHNSKTGITEMQCDFVRRDQASSITAVLKRLVSKYGLKGLPTTALMQRSAYSILQTSCPVMERDEMRAATRWKIRDLVPYAAEDAVIDVFEYPEAGQRGSERMLYVVAANSSDVEKNVLSIRKSGLDLKAIDISELALRNVISCVNKEDSAVIVLLLFEKTGMLVFVKDNELYLSRRLEVGLHDLQEKESSHEEVILELQRSLDYYESQFSQALPSKMLVYPSIEMHSELLVKIKDRLRLNVKTLTLDNLEVYKVDGATGCECSCLLAAGAALRNYFEVAA